MRQDSRPGGSPPRGKRTTFLWRATGGVILTSQMAYSLEIGFRYLRSKKRATISLITVISITGVTLGVAALLAVLSITSGFQRQFRDKVLGVNAHVLVLKYGVDFHEYRDVVEQARAEPEVVGVGPFSINNMMLAKGDRLSGVLLKGIDPDAAREVLDLPSQIIAGTMDGLRREGATPPIRPADLDSPDMPFWRDVFEAPESPDETADEGEAGEGGTEPAGGDTQASTEAIPTAPTAVASPSEVEALLGGLDDDAFALPDDDSAFLDVADDDLEDEESLESLPGLIVGATLAESMGLEVNDRVTLISALSGSAASAAFSADLPDGEPARPESHTFRVQAIFQAGFQEYDSRLVYADLYEAQRFGGHGDSVTGVEMRLRDLEQSAEVAERLERSIEGPFHTMGWEELNRPLFATLELQQLMLSIVIATIIWVAAFNVIATLIMIVIEKKSAIAILKAMGASDGTVLGVFMVQGVVIGLIGTALGLLLGGGIVGYLSAIKFPLDPKVYLIDHLPVVVSPWEFVRHRRRRVRHLRAEHAGAELVGSPNAPRGWAPAGMKRGLLMLALGAGGSASRR